MPLPRSAQLRFLLLIMLAWLAVFVITRAALLGTSWQAAQPALSDLPGLFGIGLIYDAGFVVNAALPLGIYLFLSPTRWWSTRWHRATLRVLAAVSLFAMLFTAVAEWLFWDEFGVRFNFIAVDYLVYSKEVLDNILESYPVYRVLMVLATIAVALLFALKRPLAAALDAAPLPKRQALPALAALAALALIGTLVLGQDFPRGSGGNAYQRELASNGPFQFFAAFRNNEIDYPQFYATLPDTRIAALLRDELAEPNAHFLRADPLNIRRRLDGHGAPRNLNVVLVTIESLSAKYLGSFGDPDGLTPNLDELRKHSLFFSNSYATGTRTDRGLEAITLSIPPTPGRSIVKRIGHESGYASLGQHFSARGYDTAFIYGGRGYFDNMNAFFSGNGYRIIDQSSVPAEQMHFTNAWGMCDEDLYAQTLKVADADHAQGRHFFLQLMTTSNHRPYTYPAGRIDIASGSGRAGAVKYTDYAIGRFLAEARSRPWFNDTVFVFVADHTAGSAGREDLPVANYHIPLFIYAPGQIEAREISGIVSQIDLAPTLLGMLNFDYNSTFFGRDVLHDRRAGRALIGNYQHLGLFDGHDLAILSPRRAMRRHNNALGASQEAAADRDDPLLQRDIAYYQAASYAFHHGLIAWQGDGVARTRVTQR